MARRIGAGVYAPVLPKPSDAELTVVVRGWRPEDAGQLRGQVRAAAATLHTRLWLETVGYRALGAALAAIILVYRRRRTRSEVPLV